MKINEVVSDGDSMFQSVFQTLVFLKHKNENVSGERDNKIPMEAFIRLAGENGATGLTYQTFTQLYNAHSAQFQNLIDNYNDSSLTLKNDKQESELPQSSTQNQVNSTSNGHQTTVSDMAKKTASKAFR